MHYSSRLICFCLFLYACQSQEVDRSTYCPNFKALIRPDSTLAVLSPDFHMSHDSLGRSIQEKIDGDSCGIAHIGILLNTGDTFPIHIPYPICYNSQSGCRLYNPLFAIGLNKKSEVLLNGTVYSLKTLTQEASSTDIGAQEAKSGWTDIEYDSRVSSDSVYLLLENTLALYHRRYEHLSQQMFQTSFCVLPKHQIQVLRELHPINVHIVNRLSIPPPPPPMLDSL